MTHKLSKSYVIWNGLLPSLKNIINQWHPTKLSGELKYRDALYEILKNSVPDDAVVQKEYRHLGTTIDIWLKWRGVFTVAEGGLELKLNLIKKADYDRLIGQIEGMEPSKTNIIVVLIGQVDELFLMKLRHRYTDRIDVGQPSQNTMAIIHIPVLA
jgi:hypothetical protein